VPVAARRPADVHELVASQLETARQADGTLDVERFCALVAEA
jgi:hypothetical protein